MFCSIHLGGSDQSNDLGHNDLGSNDLAPEVQAMFFVAIICVTIIWEAMIEAATLSAMISVAIILGASVKAVWMIVCEECGNKKSTYEVGEFEAVRPCRVLGQFVRSLKQKLIRSFHEGMKGGQVRAGQNSHAQG